MLRKLIRELNGTTVSEVYRNRIFDPCGLTDTYLYADETLPGAVAHGWFDINGDNIYEDITINPLISFYSAAGGGIFATATDLALWAKKIFIDGIVVNQNQLDQMTDFYTPIPNEPLVAGYGLGIVHFNPDLFNGLTIYGHSGDAPGYAAASMYLADYNVCQHGFVLPTNSI
jgi:CubicO group peptidase (beta-lactamase class C family)